MDTRNMLFRKEERVAVEDKYGENVLYDVLSGTCRRLMNNGARKFRLHPTELFYQTFFTLDFLKGKQLDRQKTYCNNELWDELYDYFCHEKGIEGADEDVRLAIACVMQAVTELLIRSGDSCYTRVAAVLKLQIERHSQDTVNMLDREFRKGFHSIDAGKLASTLCDYLQGDVLYSAEIDEMLDGLYSNNHAASVAVSTHTHIRIAEKKKTSVLIVLNAMYKAGWFVDENGQQLTNRDVTLNEILQTAFNDSCSHIAQLLKPSNNFKENKQSSLIKELLNGKEIEQFIQDLESELLRNVK